MRLPFTSRSVARNGQSQIDMGPIEPEAAVFIITLKQESWPYGGTKGADIDMLHSLNGIDWELGQSFDVIDERQGGLVVNASGFSGNPGLESVPVPDESFIATCNLPSVGQQGRMVRMVLRAAVPVGISGQIETLAFGQVPTPLQAVK